MSGGLRIAMLAPSAIRCGVADYANFLISELETLPEIESVRKIAPLDASLFQAGFSFRNRMSHRALSIEKGREFNSGDIAHIQFQYFFFGGVSPLKQLFGETLAKIRVPIVMTVHEIARADASASRFARVAIKASNKTIFRNQKIRALIVHTEADKESLISLGVEESKVHLVLHPVPEVAPAPSKEEAKMRLGLTGKTAVTLFGFLSRKKGHYVALESMKHLPEDVVLLFAGDRHPEDTTRYVPELLEACAPLIEAGRMRVTGYLEKDAVPVIMGATDVAIAPFPHSSGSGSIANYFGYGLPIVASDIAPHEYFHKLYPNCMTLFRSGDSKELADRIQFILSQPEARIRLVGGSKQFAEKHTYLDMAKKTVKIYQSALK